VSVALDDLLPPERTVCIDSGNFMGYPSMFLSVPDERGFCFTQAFQSIGLGLASAIGASIAQPRRLTVAALGDGGALMSIAELDTVARLGLDMIIVVYNDDAYGAEVHHFGPDGHDLGTVRFPETDLASIARGFGLDGLTVRRTEDMEAVATWIISDRARPLLVDVKIVDDGGALMSIAELDTIARLGLDMLIVVYNDDAYGAEVHHFGPDGHDLGAVRFPETDVASIARGFGLDGLTVRRAKDMDAVATWIVSDRSRPLLVDVKIVNDGGAWWLKEAFRGH
jgi:thiamine pyrophosphate-dependent acetolactate synthase large subunit-like protein